MYRNNRKKRMALLLMAVLLAAMVYGFAASNTVPTSYAGDGSGTVSGYSISNISYTLNSSDPSLVDKVDFTLDQSASTVQVSVDSGSTWFSCTITGGTSVSCDFPTGSEPSVQGITSLRVVAVQ